MLHDWNDGRLKLWVTHCALHARRKYRELFELGEYIPLQVTGTGERHVVAYARKFGQQMAVVATPRFAYSMMGGEDRLPIGEAWGATEIVLPPIPPGPPMKNLLTDELLPAGQQSLLCRDVFASFPLGLLLR
jgi:(1->4)-alpha-D-glucan 1-alpha-D-glucosylmutase